MDYEKKYKEALERMKSWARGEHPECFTEAQKTAEFIFPELAESEGERIRKGIFKALSKKDARDVLISQGIEVSDALAWLEKQGDKDKLIQDLGKYKVKYTQEVLEKYVNSMSIKDDERLRKTTIAFLKDFAEQGYENAVECIDWLEKQDELRSTDKEEPTDYNSIDPCFGKPIDNVEPKFKVGDWISHNTANFVFQVVSFGSCGYEVINRDNYTKTISFDNEDKYHLWTLQDAKPYDILATKSGRPFIFKGFSDVKHPNNPTAYCGINTLDDFIISSGTCWWTDEEVYSATKEQYDLLFQKMKEAGYRWENNQLEEINNKGFVDLGLPSGTLWATCNLGAEKETDFGLFYQWGDTQGYEDTSEHQFSWNDYKWGTSSNLTKYNSTDGKLVLDNEDDPVFVATNGNFKLPTKEQLQELIDNTNHEWTEVDGVRGMKFINKNDDTKYIFIPAAGYCDDGSHNGVGSWGYVWAASRNESYANLVWVMYFDADDVYMYYSLCRCLGYSVRGVINS